MILSPSRVRTLDPRRARKDLYPLIASLRALLAIRFAFNLTFCMRLLAGLPLALFALPIVFPFWYVPVPFLTCWVEMIGDKIIPVSTVV